MQGEKEKTPLDKMIYHKGMKKYHLAKEVLGIDKATFSVKNTNNNTGRGFTQGEKELLAKALGCQAFDIFPEVVEL